MKRGSGGRPLLKSDIEIAQQNCKSAAQAARYLNVSYNTYKKYAKMYGVFENLKNPKGIGIRHSRQGTIANIRSILEQILSSGVIPKSRNVYTLRKELIEHGYLEQRCAVCGFDEKRITDNRAPLMLEFVDGNKENWKIENLQFLCFNCTFLTRGNIHGRKRKQENDEQTSNFEG